MSSSLRVFFFFYGYGDTRDLHSFPTRRSSDLDPQMTFEEAARRRDFTINAILYDPLADEFIDPYGGIRDLQQKRLRAVAAEDRKSTRLNSSHEWISYAVFCLKKKKNKKK